MKTAITPTRQENYPKWYQEIIKAADLAEISDVRGCMVIKPWGYAIWENMQKELDQKFKDTGHENAYFPLFIPLSYMEKEAKHIEGFAKECAVVTHHRLETNNDGKLIPVGKLDEPLIVRPTSETIIGASYAKWVKSYRDLPILINQWANVVRWEMRTRIFLRTTEFLWQEGHTAHTTKEEAIDETMKMLQVYKTFAEEILAIPIFDGEKTESERFAGAENTYSVEAMMQDRKALQFGTSHFLGQNFAKGFDIKFQNKTKEIEYAWTTSWGVSSRMIGALIMVHSDDNGLVLPPRIASAQIVILPIYRNKEEKTKVMKYIEEINQELKIKTYHGKKLVIKIDDREMNGGEKNWKWIKKGVPIKLEIGPKDFEKNSVALVRRDDPELKKQFIDKNNFITKVLEILDDIQNSLFNKAKDFTNKHLYTIDNYEEFKNIFTPNNSKQPEIHGGFILAHWCGNHECEQKINEELKVTIRNIPNNKNQESGQCIYCKNKSTKRVLWAKSY